MAFQPFTPLPSPSEGSNGFKPLTPLPTVPQGGNGNFQPYTSGIVYNEPASPTNTPAPNKQPTNTKGDLFSSIIHGTESALSGIGQGLKEGDNIINKGVDIFSNLPGVKQAFQVSQDAFSKIINSRLGINTPVGISSPIGLNGLITNMGDTGGRTLIQSLNDTLKEFSPKGQQVYAPAKEGQPEDIQQLSQRTAERQAATNKQLQNNQWYVDLNREAAIGMASLINGATVNKPLPDSIQPQNTQEKIFSGVANALGNIYAIGKLQHVFATFAYGNSTVQAVLQQYPKLAWMPGFLSQIVGLDIRAQLDPTIKDRFSQFASDLVLGGIQQGTGMIPNIGKMPSFVLTSPINFGIFYGLAKLHGASNQDALIAGGIGAGLDLGSKMAEIGFAARMEDGTLHMTPKEAMQIIVGGDLQNTPLGKDLLKSAIQAHNNGQEIDLIPGTPKGESTSDEFSGNTISGKNYTIRFTEKGAASNNSSTPLLDQIKNIVNDEKGSVSIGGMINGDKPLLSLEQEAAKDAYMHGNKEAVNTIQSAGEHMSGGVEAVHANYEDAVQAGDYDLARELAQQAAKAGDTTLLKLAGDLSPEAYKEPANIGNSNEAGGIDFFAKVEMPAITKEIHGFTSQIPEEELNKDAGGLVENPQIIAGILDDTVTQEQVAEALKGIPPIVITLGNTSVVQTPTNEQLRVDVVSPELQSLQEQLNIPQTPENQPSIAIANLLPNAGQQYAQSTALAGLPVTLPEITFNTQSGKQITVPLMSPAGNQPLTAQLPSSTAGTPFNGTLPALPSKGLSPTNGKQTTDQNPFIQPPTKGGNAPAFSVPLRKGGNETGIIKEAIKTGQRETALKLYNGYRIKGRFLPGFPIIHQEALTEMKTTKQRLQGIKSFITTQMQHAPGAKQLMEATQTLQNHYKEVYAPSDERPRHMEYHAAKGEVTSFYPESEEIVTKLTDAKSFADFTHQTALLAKEYGGAFTNLYDKIESGIITKEEYDNFKTYYEAIQAENNRSERVPAGDESKTPAASQTSSQSIQSAENRQSVQGGAHAEQKPQSTESSNTPIGHDQAGENRNIIINESAKPESSGASTNNRGGNGAFSTEPVERTDSTAGRDEQLIPGHLQPFVPAYLHPKGESLVGEEARQYIINHPEQFPPDYVKAQKENDLTLKPAEEEGDTQARLYDTRITKKAIEKFGTTNVPESAGFITPQGEIIDSSGKTQGSMNEGRNVDHREIAIYAIPDNAKTHGMSGSDALSYFMEKTGSTRVSVMPDEVNIDTLNSLTDEQLSQIEKLAQGKTIQADISRPDGSVKVSGTFNDIGKYKSWLQKNIQQPAEEEGDTQARLSNAGNPIFDHLNKEDLKLYGKNTPEIGRGYFGGESGTGIELAKNASRELDQVGILGQASKSIEVRRDARAIVYLLSNRVSDETRIARLQKLSQNLESKGTAEGNVIENAINKLTESHDDLKATKEMKVGDVLDPQGHTNMVGKVTIREIAGNTIKFTDSNGTDFYGMQRSLVRDLIKGGSWKRVENPKQDLTLQPSKATNLNEHQLEQMEAGMTPDLVGNRKTITQPQITKADIKTLIENDPEFKANPVLTVEERVNGEKYLSFTGKKTSFSISIKAFGLNGDKLEAGQEIRVNPDTLKGTVKQMRVYSGSSVYASTGASPLGSYEKVPEVKSEASNFKLFKEVEGLIDKYAKLIGEGYLPRNAKGVYYSDTKNIRVTGMNDLSVASHEITHFLDMKDAISKRIMEITGETKDGKPIYSAKSKGLRKEMTAIYTKYYPGGKKTNKLNKRVTEGFAILLQKYVEMPSTIAAEFPNLVKSFLQPEGQYYKPVMGEIIKDLRGIVSKYQGLDALDKVGARVTSEKNPIQKDSYFNFRDKLRNTFVDSIWNFEKLSNLAGKGRTVDDPSMWMRFAPNHAAIFGNNISSNKGYFAYRDGEFRKVSDANWNTLIKGLDKEKQLDSFGYYLVARDQYFNWQQLDKLKTDLVQKTEAIQQLKESADGTPLSQIEGAKELVQEANKARQDYINQKKVLDNNGFTRQEIEDAYNQNNTRWPKEEKLFDTLTHEMLKLANHPDVMLLSPDQYNKLSSKEGYASMKRQIYDELVGNKETPNQLNVGKTRISSFIQRKGGTNTIINPLYNALTNEAEILKKSLTQIVYNKMGIIAREANFPDLFQPQQVKTAVDNTGHISFPQEKDNNIIMARMNYKRYPILTDNKIKSAVDDLLTYQHMHLVDQLLVGSNRFFTHGTTALYTQFALTNFIRHQVDASAQSQNRYIPLYQPMKTLTDVLIRRNSQEAKWGVEYLTLGGMKQTLAGWQDQSPAELMKTITNERNGLIKAIDLLDKGMNVLAIPAKYTEITTRMGEYISSRKAGNPQVVALEDAGRVTAPFHHIGELGGKRGQMFVKSIPFFNADLQYMDQAMRSLANPKTRGRYIFITALVIASMVAAGQYLLHFGSKDQKQTYKDLQPNDLGRYIWLPSPDGKTLLKFPMPQQMTPIGTMLNMLLSQQFERANYSIPDFLQGAGVFLPNPLNVTDFGRFITTYMPQFIKPAFEVAANVRDYPQFMPLVSQSLQGLPPPLQYNKGTSPLAIKLGEMFNLSPIKIDYLILGYLGRAAGYLTGRPANFNPVGGVTQAQYFEGGRTIQNFYNSKQTNDQLYSAAYRGITKLGSQKDTVIRNHEYDLLISRYLTAYRKVDINADPQKASKMRDEILQLIDKRNK